MVAVLLPWTRINDWLAVAGQYWRRKIVGHLNNANNYNNLDPLKSSCAVVNPIIQRATLSPSSLVVKRDPKHSSPPRPSSHPWRNISLSIRKNCCCGFGDARPRAIIIIIIIVPRLCQLAIINNYYLTSSGGPWNIEATQKLAYKKARRSLRLQLGVCLFFPGHTHCVVDRSIWVHCNVRLVSQEEVLPTTAGRNYSLGANLIIHQFYCREIKVAQNHDIKTKLSYWKVRFWVDFEGCILGTWTW